MLSQWKGLLSLQCIFERKAGWKEDSDVATGMNYGLASFFS